MNILVSHAIADNTSFVSGLNSTAFDRSYNSSAVELRASKRLVKYFNKINIGYGLSYRSYLSEKISDPLHSGRSHWENFLSLSILKELRNDIDIELKYRVRYRKTNSEFDWVESLKTFYDNQFMIKITYYTDVDLFY